MRAAGENPRSRPRDEAGFTVIEVVVAALLLAAGALAVLGLVSAASRNNYRSQESQVVNDKLQQEIEKIRQLPYASVALTSAPPHSSDPANPNYRVSGTQFNVNHTGAAASWNLVYNGGPASDNGTTVSGGAIDPGPTPFQSGSVSGQIYRYVVWEPQSGCTNCVHDKNSDFYNGQRVAWFKHVVVAIALNHTAAGGTRAYQEVQADAGNGSQGGCTPPNCDPGQKNATPWTFWLTDTSCGPPDTRQPIAGQHLTHNTLGLCSAGQQSGAVPGAPDLMFTQGAPCVGGDCSLAQPLYDYATDVEPGCGSTDCNTQDRGLQAQTPTAPGCLLTNNGGNSILVAPLAETNPQWKFHEWLSAPVPTNAPGISNILLDGTGALDLWTQTIGGTPYGGKICIWLFVRGTATVAGVPTTVDTLALDSTTHLPYMTYSCPAPPITPLNADCPQGWPSGDKWTEIHVPLTFNQLTLPLDSRLGLAIGAASPDTPSASGLQFMYDHPTYDSRLTLDTHSALPF